MRRKALYTQMHTHAHTRRPVLARQMRRQTSKESSRAPPSNVTADQQRIIKSSTQQCDSNSLTDAAAALYVYRAACVYVRVKNSQPSGPTAVMSDVTMFDDRCLESLSSSCKQRRSTTRHDTAQHNATQRCVSARQRLQQYHSTATERNGCVYA